MSSQKLAVTHKPKEVEGDAMEQVVLAAEFQGVFYKETRKQGNLEGALQGKDTPSLLGLLFPSPPHSL